MTPETTAFSRAAGALLLILSAFASVASAAAQESLIKGPYLVADMKSGAVYEHHDALRPWYPASITKLMTVYTALRAVKAGEITLKSPVRMSAKAKSQPPSKIGYAVGTVVTVENAIRILMVKSANDMAVALAEAVGGSEAAFAARMNAEAARIGMTRSHFVNPHGLPDPGNVTTARDMALLARQLLLEFPEHRGFFGIHAIRVGNKTMRNYNTLVDHYRGATGMKTGFICSSGFNLVASARRDGREMVAVVLGAYSSTDRAERAASLLDEGFRSGGGFFKREKTNLANVTSGAAYGEPIDLRPIICSNKRPAAQAEMFAEPKFQITENGALLVNPDGTTTPSRLGPRIDFGPPIVITTGGAEGPAGAPAADIAVASRGVAAPLPSARPQIEVRQKPALATAFVSSASAAEAVQGTQATQATQATLTAAPAAPLSLIAEPAEEEQGGVPRPRARPARTLTN